MVEYLLFLKQQPDWTERDALCSIAYDEIHLNPFAQFDTKNQRCVGAHKAATLVMIRGLVSKKAWKFPLKTKFDYSIDQNDYIELVTKLFQMGFTVKLSVCDMGSKNIALANENNFNITKEKPWIPHPCDSNQKAKLKL